MIRRHPVLIWAGITVALVFVSFAIPDSVFESVQGAYSVDVERSAFSDDVVLLEQSFDEVETFVPTAENRDTLAYVAVRKLLRKSKLNDTEIDASQPIVVDALERLARSPESKESISKRTSEKLSNVLPRMKPDDVKDAMTQFFHKLRPGGAPVSDDAACATCHQQMQLLPGDARFDAVGLYPGIDTEVFRGGRSFPVMNEFIDVRESTKLMGTETTPEQSCTTCHQPHGRKNHAVTLETRRDNLGFWLNLDSDPIPGMLDVEVKLKSFKSAHRVPGGKPNRAYVIAVEAFDSDDQPLKIWWGDRLPTELSPKNKPGVVFAKRLIDADGKLTTDPKQAVDLLHDHRLEHGRFSAKHFLFVSDGRARVVATLYYLPKFPSWEDRVEVIQIEKSR